MNIKKRKLIKIGALLTFIAAIVYLAASILFFIYSAESNIRKIAQNQIGSFVVTATTDGGVKPNGEDTSALVKEKFNKSESKMLKNAHITFQGDVVSITLKSHIGSRDLLAALSSPASIRITNSTQLNATEHYGGVIIDGSDFDNILTFDIAEQNKFGIRISLNEQGSTELLALSNDAVQNKLYYYIDDAEPEEVSFSVDEQGTHGYINILPFNNQDQADELLIRAIMGTLNSKLTLLSANETKTVGYVKNVFIALGSVFMAMFVMASLGAWLLKYAINRPREFKNRRKAYVSGLIFALIANCGVNVPMIFLYVALGLEDDEPKKKNIKLEKLDIPSAYDDPEKAKKFVKLLKQMRDSGEISKEEYKSILGDVLKK